MASQEAEARAAMTMGMSAENDRRGHYAGLAGGYAGQSGGGDLMALPEVPPTAIPSEDPDWYPKGGDEPIVGG
jgi:hypothetical protein